ncbi:MAG: PAS domain S-box protein [Acidobacteriota bacterium]
MTDPQHPAPRASDQPLLARAWRRAAIAATRFRFTRRKLDLRLTTERLALALEGARTGLWDWHVDANALTWSGQVEVLFGMAPGSFAGTFEAYLAMVHPDDRGMLQEAIQAALAHPSEPYRVEHRIVRPDGTNRWVEGRGHVYCGAHGRPERMAGSITDVTDRRETEQALRQSEERFRLLADATAEGIAITDEGIIVHANQQLLDMLGLTAPDVIGHRAAPSVTGGSVEDINAQPGATSTAAYEVVVRRTDGSSIPVAVRARYTQLGAKRFRIAVVRDLTETRRAQDDRVALERQVQHSQKLESLGVLAGGIAHDFNNLLVAILGNIELALGDAPWQSPLTAYLREAETAARRVAALTAKLLAYSGRGRFEVRPLDINALIEEMSSTLRASIRPSIRFDAILAPDLPPVEGDPSQIQQLVMSLIVNAAEAIGDNAGRITLTTEAHDLTTEELRKGYVPDVESAGRFALLTVIDTGAGMEPAVQERLFEPFFTTKFAGRGLGMSAVLGILRAHKGTIFVDSQPGHGTTVTAVLPAGSAAGRADVDRRVVGAAAADPVHAASQTVLVVDDEDAVRSICCQMLERLGYGVASVSSGHEAIELLQQPDTDVGCVLLDLTMPGMDGAETAAEIQALHPDLPIVIVSGFSESEVVERLGARRVTAVVQKPYRIATLRNILSPLLPPLNSEAPPPAGV